MPNMKSIILSHNKHVLLNLNSATQQADTCNCRKKKADCPLEGKCIQTNVAIVTTETKTETYVMNNISLIYIIIYIIINNLIYIIILKNIRNVTETTRHPFDARIEEMKQNSQYMFGLYRRPKNLSK